MGKGSTDGHEKWAREGYGDVFLYSFEILMTVDRKSANCKSFGAGK